jgi:hypothetical protein
MKAKTLLISLIASHSSLALAGELTLGEMGTAATLEDQDIIIHPLANPSYIGINDELQLDTVLIGNLGAPNVGAEYSLSRTESQMVSVRVGVVHQLALADNPSATSGGVTLNYSSQVGEGWVTGSVGAGLVYSGNSAALSNVPVSVSYLIPNGNQAWNFVAAFDPYVIGLTGTTIALVQAKWHVAPAVFDRFRLGVGVNVLVNGYALSGADQLSDTEIPSLPVFPLPALSLAWRI